MSWPVAAKKAMSRASGVRVAVDESMHALTALSEMAPASGKKPEATGKRRLSDTRTALVCITWRFHGKLRRRAFYEWENGSCPLESRYDRMKLRVWRRVWQWVFRSGLGAHAQETGRGRKYKPPPPTCKVTVTVVKAYNGKAARGRFGCLSSPQERQRMRRHGAEDERGRQSERLDMIPSVTPCACRCFATASQTFGERNTICPATSKENRGEALEAPQKQYSIYQNILAMTASRRRPETSGQQATAGPEAPQIAARRWFCRTGMSRPGFRTYRRLSRIRTSSGFLRSTAT